MKISVQTMVARAWALFRFDQPALASPFFSDGASKLGREFDFDEVATELRNDGARVWAARSGRVSLHGHDRMISMLQGHPLDLLIELRVDSPQANTTDASAELQACFDFISGKGAPPLTSIADILSTTTAVVRLDRPIYAFLPFAAELRDRYVSRLPPESRPEPLVRFNLEIAQVVRGRRINRGITFEQRATSETSDLMYFTQSALPPRDHMALLEELVGA